MSWPWRRERGRHAAGTPARRPAEVAPPVVVPTVAAPSVAVPAVVAPPDPAVPAAPPTEHPDVRLGFDDGSEVQLGAGDPRAEALRAVADVLLRPRSV